MDVELCPITLLEAVCKCSLIVSRVIHVTSLLTVRQILQKKAQTLFLYSHLILLLVDS